MSTPYDQEIEHLLAEYQKRRTEAVETRRQINEVTATVTAPRQVVKVTVSAQGELNSIEFPTSAFRRMPPKELGEVLQTTIQQARAKALDLVGELTSRHLPPGVTTADLLQGRVDPTVLIPKAPQMPDAVRAYIDTGRPETPSSDLR